MHKCLVCDAQLTDEEVKGSLVLAAMLNSHLSKTACCLVCIGNFKKVR